MLPFLNEHNEATLLEICEDDAHYCCLEYASEAARDFIFPPLIYLDLFTVETITVEIAGAVISLPRDWSIVVGDRDIGCLEAIPIARAVEHDHEALVYNPISSSMPAFAAIRLKGRGEAAEWAVPRVKKGHMLCVPLRSGDQPPCIIVAHDTSRMYGAGEIDLSELV